MSDEKKLTKKPAEAKRSAAATNFSVISNTVETPGGVLATRSEGRLHIGPLPSATTLREYQEISPEIVPALLEAFVEQGKHRRSSENWVYKGGTIRSLLGVIFAFTIGMTALLGGIYLVLHGFSVAGTIFGGFGIAGLINAFLQGTRARRERQELTTEYSDDGLSE